jgi:YfiH family protein
MQPLSGCFGLQELPCGWQVGRFGALAALPGLVHAVTTRQGPAVLRMRDDFAGSAPQLAAALGLEHLAFCRQVHGAAVHVVDEPGLAGDGDGLVTMRPGLGLMVRSADCTLVLAVDPLAECVGAAHASWRGTLAGVTAALVRRMVDDCGCDAGRIVACICPSAGACCYEVGADVADAAAEALGAEAREFIIHRGGRMYMDLWAANVAQLRRQGVPPAGIHVAGVCNMCRNDLFPSHRREAGNAGRFAAVIGLAAR